jgi:hypothetical protein
MKYGVVVGDAGAKARCHHETPPNRVWERRRKLRQRQPFFCRLPTDMQLLMGLSIAN